MYKYKLEDVLIEKHLSAIVKDFLNNEFPRFIHLDNYYLVKNKIFERTMSDGKVNNKLAHGFASYITNMATGYFIGKGLRYNLPDENKDYKELLYEVLDANYTDNANFEIAKEASKKGIAFEILYLDEKSRLRSQKLKAEEVIPIYSPNLGEFLECAIRIWTIKEISGTITDYAAVYTRSEVITYQKAHDKEQYVLCDRTGHKMDDIPIIVYWNNEELTGDYENIISLLDAYDKAQSDTANDNEYFTDAYLVIIGALGGISSADGGADDEDDEEVIKDFRKNRILHMDEKGQAQWLVKNVNDSAQENYKKRLHSDIFFLAQVPAMTDENFSGNLTGVALRYKLVGLEQLTIMKENKFLAAQKKKLKMITGFINKKHNKSFNSSVVEILSERNFIDNLTEIIENAEKLDGIVSRETQLGLLPFVKDVNEELEKIKAENMESQGLGKIPKDYYFGDLDDPEDNG